MSGGGSLKGSVFGAGGGPGGSSKGSVGPPASTPGGEEEGPSAAALEEAAIRAQLGGPLKRHTANHDGTVTAQTRLGPVTYRPAAHVAVQRVQLSSP